MSKTEIPSIRFRGFDDAWEQRKLGEVATFINGRAYSQPELLSSGKYKVLRVGNFYTNDSWYYSDLELGEKYYADYGDLLYTWSATFGPHIWLGDRAIYHYHIWKINLSDQLEKQFAVQLLEQDRANILSSKNGSTMVHITKEGMEQKDVIISPNTKEQQEIGAFFLQLDNLITLHQRKFEKLTNVKKSMLEKMFPQNGSSYPEIRFKGFTDPWEQRKVGEVSESYSGGTPSVGVKEYYGGQIPFIRSAEINSEITELFLTEEGLKNSSARLVAVGDIMYALYGATSGEVGRARLIGAINQAVLAIKPHTDYDSEYLAQWLRKSKHSIIETYLQGGQGNLSGTIVKELSVDFPSLKEQKAIGDFFRQLDNLITLHQCELEKLQSIKKSLLEKMFV